MEEAQKALMQLRQENQRKQKVVDKRLEGLRTVSVARIQMLLDEQETIVNEFHSALEIFHLDEAEVEEHKRAFAAELAVVLPPHSSRTS